jgi:hypothetical protein
MLSSVCTVWPKKERWKLTRKCDSIREQGDGLVCVVAEWKARSSYHEGQLDGLLGRHHR